MIDIQQIRDIVIQIFSDFGYKKNNVTIKFPKPLNIKVEQENENISIDFKSNLPYISWKKLIRLSAYINGFTFGEKAGTIKLKYLPDITFSYESTQNFMSQIFEDNFGSLNLLDIEDEINSKFKDETRQKLAKKCLLYGNEWAKIASTSCDFKCLTETQKNKMKQECSDFIRENILEEEKRGSVVLTFILIYVLLPVILKFIVERIFRKLFE
jgi:hypothetical protein